ncbi:MAG: GNAT family N-acetyltransferase [Tannerellaceae bacterium]|jgi:RimJ/RimL family protein N-acetyltransferase|nr:GNAT family N-acetyltransferase [Tannerellaceae bacterium]
MKAIISHPLFAVRPWEPSDAASLAFHANDVRISRNVRDAFPNPYAISDAEAYIASTFHPSAAGCNFAIVINNEAAGGIGIIPQTDVERYSAEIGYWLGATYHNRGIMTEAVRTFAAYVFEHTSLVRLFASVFDFNIASARTLEKAGFRLVGKLRKAGFKDGRFVDMGYYELIGN